MNFKENKWFSCLLSLNWDKTDDLLVFVSLPYEKQQCFHSLLKIPELNPPSSNKRNKIPNQIGQNVSFFALKQTKETRDYKFILLVGVTDSFSTNFGVIFNNVKSRRIKINAGIFKEFFQFCMVLLLGIKQFFSFCYWIFLVSTLESK